MPPFRAGLGLVPVVLLGASCLSQAYGAERMLVPPWEVRVTATSEETAAFKGGAANVSDGDRGNRWDAKWGAKLPQAITLDLGGPRKVCLVAFQPVPQANVPRPTGYRVLVSADGDAFTEVAAGKWPAADAVLGPPADDDRVREDRRERVVEFSPVRATHVRFEITSGGATAAEIGVGIQVPRLPEPPISASDETYDNAILDVPHRVVHAYNVRYDIDPNLDLGRQTDAYAAQTRPLVPLGPAIIAGEGPHADNATLVRVFNQQQAKMAQFLAYAPAVTGGVHVAWLAGSDREDGLIATAPMAETGVRVLRLFDRQGGLRQTVTVADLDAPYVITAGRFLADRDHDLLAIASRDEGPATLDVAVYCPRTRAFVSRVRLPSAGDRGDAVQLDAIRATDRTAHDRLLIYRQEARRADVVSLAENGQHHAVETTMLETLGGDRGLHPSAFEGERFIASGTGGPLSEIVVVDAAGRLKAVNVGHRENQLFVPMKMSGPVGYIRQGRMAHTRVLERANHPDDPTFNRLSGWAGAYPCVEGPPAATLPTLHQLAYTPYGCTIWKGREPEWMARAIDEATGMPTYHAATRHNRVTWNDANFVLTAAPQLEARARFIFWGVRGYVRNLMVDVRGKEGAAPDLSVIGVAMGHEHGSGPDYNPNNIRGFLAHLLKLYGSLENVNRRFGTAFRSPGDFDAPRTTEWKGHAGWESEAPAHVSRGPWDEVLSDFGREWNLYLRSTVNMALLWGHREAMLAGVPSELIKGHQVPDAYLTNHDYTGHPDLGFNHPIDVLFSCGNSMGASAYGPWYDRKRNWLQAAKSSGQTQVTIGEFSITDGKDMERSLRQMETLYADGLVYANGGADVEWKALIAKRAHTPRPPVTGGTGQVRSWRQPQWDYVVEPVVNTTWSRQQLGSGDVWRPSGQRWTSYLPSDRGQTKSYNVVQVGAGPDRNGLLKSVNRDGTWEGTVYLVPFHAHVGVTPLAAESSRLLDGCGVFDTFALQHGDQVEICCRARASRATARLAVDVRVDARMDAHHAWDTAKAIRAVAQHDAVVVDVPPAAAHLPPKERQRLAEEGVAPVVPDTAAWLPAADVRAALASGSGLERAHTEWELTDDWREVRFVLANQLPVQNLRLVLSADGGRAVELADVCVTVQREQVARPAFRIWEGQPHRGGVSFDLVRRPGPQAHVR